jgi:hypothetical protein
VVDWLTDEFNPRELATLTWLLVIGAYFLSRRDGRRTVGSLLRILASPVFVVAIAISIGWFLGLIVLAADKGIWTADLRNDTVAATVAGVVTILGSWDRVGDFFFRRALRRALEAGALLGAFVGLQQMSYLIELLLLPAVTILALVAALATPEQEDAAKFARGLLSVIGLCVIAAVVWKLIAEADPEKAGRAFLLPLWMAVGAVPLSYAFGLYVHHGSALTHLRATAERQGRPKGAIRRAQVALLLGLNVQARHVDGFHEPWTTHLLAARNIGEAAEVVRIFRMNAAGVRRQGRYADAGAFFDSWVDATELPEALADVRFEALATAWKRLDRLQRAEFVRAYGWLVTEERRESQLRGLTGWGDAESRIGAEDARSDAPADV